MTPVLAAAGAVAAWLVVMRITWRLIYLQSGDASLHPGHD